MLLNRAAVKRQVRDRFKAEGMRHLVLLIFLVFLLSLPASLFANLDDILQQPLSGMETTQKQLETAFALLRLGYSTFVLDIVAIGLWGCMLRYATGERPQGKDLFSAFGFYGKALGLAVKSDLLVLAWSCLLIVPGVIKTYSYSMARYILCENPAVSAGKALDMSIRMTKGHKKELFWLDVSFFGWYLLSFITLGVAGLLFVGPYSHAVKAQYYLKLKQHALSTGAVEKKEFTTATYHKPYV